MAPAPAPKPAAGLSSSAGSSEHIRVAPGMKAEDAECSDSAASSMDHLAPFCSSSPGASYNGAAALAWHDDGETTDDQDEAGWQLVAGHKASHKAGGTHSSSAGSHGKAAVCGRCGMKGHVSSRCRQPHCSRCNKWWHTEDECSRACHACGSLDHKITASTPLCKSYKCRECGLYGHVYAECPNIVCNLCKQVGHKALDCPSIICNLCKQQGHKAVNCPNPRGLQQQAAPSAGSSSKPASKPAAAQHVDEQPALKLRPAVPQQLRQSGSSCGSAASPTSFAAAAAAETASGAGAGSQHTPTLGTPTQQQQAQQAAAALHEDVPLAPALPQPATAAEMQARQQQQSQLLSQLYKAAPEAAVSFLDNSSKLQALYCVEPGFLLRLFAGLQQQAASEQQSLLEAVVQSVYRQQQQQQHNQQPSQQQAWQQPLLHAAAPSPAASQLEQQHPLRHALSWSSSSTPTSPATPKVLLGGDVGDATQGIKPGDLAPQLAKQLVAEFGDMLPTRWQQLPSWRQLEARLSFPDGNYVQRRLQFREKRRQLQLLTLQMRAAAAAARQQAAAGRAAAGAAGRPAGSKASVRVVPQVPSAAGAAGAPAAATAAARSAGTAPNSYAAALAGHKAASAAGGSSAATHAAAAADHGAGTADTSAAAAVGGADPACGVDGASSSVDAVSTPAAGVSSADSGSSSSAATAAPTPQSAQSVASAIAVCRRCGMMGHAAQYCAQPKCSRCHLWWHSEAQCASACQFCGSLDHQGDAEQPASCQSFRCKACKMFGHTASTCPHVQLHTQQEKARQQQQLLGTPHEQQQQLVQHQAIGISPVATPTSAAAVASSLSSSTNSLSYQQLALQAPASPLSKFGGASNSSMAWDSPLRPPDSPGLGQNGVKPKDLLPEHAKALQEEFPNALPLNWQQMASWRMVEERLRVVAVEGAVFSKRRQMWRDRRKYYQVLTAQALAAAARSAADDAAGAGATAAGEAVIAAVAQQGAAAAAAQSGDSTTNQDAAAAALETDASSKEPSAAPDQQHEMQEVEQGGPAAAAAAPPSVEQQHSGQPAADEQQQEPGRLANATQPQQQQQQQPASRQLALLAHREEDHLVPEWQQQRGSLFGLSALPCGTQDSLGAAAPVSSSGFCCDTASFCCSPMPAVTPSVLMSPIGPDAYGTSAGNTPCPMMGPGSCLSTPGMFGGPVPNGRLPVPGPLQGQAPVSQGMSPRPSGLQHAAAPMPTPRGAAAAAAAMAAAASSGAPAMGPYGVMMGPVPGDNMAAGAYSPAHYAGPAGMPPRGTPLGYGMPQQSSPMPQHPAAGRGMPPGMHMNGNMPGGPGLYQHMLVAQRQSQLQQQLLLQSPYAPRGPPVGADAAAAAGNQAMLNMQMQQQQARMQRQRRLEQALVGQQMQPGPGMRQQQGPEEFADTGELDDKLGVLGVLGLQ